VTAPPYIYPEPTEYRHATFPLASSNQWAYADTNYNPYTTPPTPDGASLSLATIEGYTGESSHGKWQLTGGILYSISNDTIIIEDNYSQDLNPRIAYLPSSSIQDTAIIVGPRSSAVTKIFVLGHNMVTPAGVFDSVYVYEVNDNFLQHIYFRPGIGVIGSDAFTSNKLLMFKSVLISYVLVK